MANKKKPKIQVDSEYLKAYYANEADANKQMSLANAAAAVYMLVIWILYLTDKFHAYSDVTRWLVYIAFPIGIIMLLTPLLYVFKFKDKLRKPNYKLFVLFSFVFVIMVLNSILPKHTVLAWALCIVMTNHYYNTKVGLTVFIAVLVCSLLSMYAGMFIGEFEADLLVGNEAMKDGFVLSIAEGTYDGPEGRYKLLHEVMLAGHNRYIEVLGYYYFPRVVLLGLVFLVSNALNKRTYKLLVSEIHVNSEQSKAKTELEVAKEIQLNTLPSEMASSEDVEIVAELKAAKEVGGDFYDYIKIDDNHIAVVIGDVSGKGVPAAMFMMKTITCCRNFIREGKTPSEILKEVNRAIYDENSQMFVTCFLAILDKRNGELVFANAGHNPPIIGSDRKFRYLKCKSGFVLGGLEEAFVEDEKIKLEPNESLTLYTDGVTEARNIKGDFFGEERLIETCNKKDYTCLVEFHHGIKDNVASFVGEADPSDDLTLITIKYHGDQYSYKENFFDGVLDNVPAMLDFIETFCDEQKLQREFKSSLLVVGDELISNIVKYGYENKGGVIFIRQLYNIDKKEYVLTIIDKAPAFNQLEVDNPMVGNDADKETVGGLGILIVKKIMSEYAYDRINGKNILVLRKRF